MCYSHMLHGSSGMLNVCPKNKPSCYHKLRLQSQLCFKKLYQTLCTQITLTISNTVACWHSVWGQGSSHVWRPDEWLLSHFLAHRPTHHNPETAVSPPIRQSTASCSMDVSVTVWLSVLSPSQWLTFWQLWTCPTTLAAWPQCRAPAVWCTGYAPEHLTWPCLQNIPSSCTPTIGAAWGCISWGVSHLTPVPLFFLSPLRPHPFSRSSPPP